MISTTSHFSKTIHASKDSTLANSEVIIKILSFPPVTRLQNEFAVAGRPCQNSGGSPGSFALCDSPKLQRICRVLLGGSWLVLARSLKLHSLHQTGAVRLWLVHTHRVHHRHYRDAHTSHHPGFAIMRKIAYRPEIAQNPDLILDFCQLSD